MGRKATGPTGIAGLPRQKEFCGARGLYFCIWTRASFLGALIHMKGGVFDVENWNMSVLSRFCESLHGQRSGVLRS